MCLIAQFIIDKTSLTPAKILVGYVVAGVILTAIGVYEPIVEFAKAGATVVLVTSMSRKNKPRSWFQKGIKPWHIAATCPIHGL